MHALILDGESSSHLRRAPLASGGHDEKWLQALLFRHPELIPIEQIDPGAQRLVPICRELAIPKDGGTVFLDMLGVTAQGRLVLVECKLWRNPQARREVVAQILEYAALLHQWTYADLTARLAPLLGRGANPLYALARQAVAELDEVRFVEAVSRSLLIGDFDLIVAGDGIRSDLQAIAGHLNGHASLAARLALVEFQLWTDAEGRTLVIPTLPLRTQVIEHRVITDQRGLPLRPALAEAAEQEVEAVVDPEQAAGRDRDRAFWQRFIDDVRFDHPDQPAPRHGGRNWVRIDLPPPAGSMTAYRSRDRIGGLFITLAQEAGANAFAQLEAEADTLRQETGLALTFDRKREHPFQGVISADREIDGVDDDAMLAWFRDASNRMVNAFRPRLSTFVRAS